MVNIFVYTCRNDLWHPIYNNETQFQKHDNDCKTGYYQNHDGMMENYGVSNARNLPANIKKNVKIIWIKEKG